MNEITFDLHVHPLGELRYAVNCTLAAAHGCVVMLWNRTTIPKHYALPYTTASAHFTTSNCRFQVQPEILSWTVCLSIACRSDSGVLLSIMNFLLRGSMPIYTKTLLAGLLLITLLTACGKPDQPTINLYRAVHADDIDQIERNIYWGADVNQAGPDGDYPIHVAAKRGNRAIVEMLLKKNARIDTLNHEQMTPLYSALMHGRIQTAELLIKQHAAFEPNELLHEVARSGITYKGVIHFLLNNGADIDNRDSAGNTPLNIAIMGNHRVLVRQLVTRGADVNSKNSAGDTPLQLANKTANRTIIKLLEQYGAN